MKAVIEPSGKEIEIKGHETILSSIIATGLFVPASCGGNGICGRCRVILEDGEVFGDANKGDFILACQTKAKTDIKIRIPISSSILDRSVLKKGLIFEDTELIHKFTPNPLIEKRFIKLPCPTQDDNIDDLSRIRRLIGWDYKISYDCLKSLSNILRKKNFEITLSIKDEEIIRIEEGNRENFHYGISFDIGTTSVYGRLIDLKNKKSLSIVSSYNDQIRYGDDVITRIVYANKGGLHNLQKSVVGTMEEIIDELLKEAKLQRSDMSYIVCSGNTTMAHLMLGISPKYIREEPYTPTITGRFSIPASILGFKFDPSVILYTLPCVSSYIGSDIIAGVTACSMKESREITLYVDLGTNGEIVLGNCDFLLSCSTSAGPCFEGGGIKCGMRPQVGAIEDVEIDRDGDPNLMVIGGGKPTGICGVGLINLLSGLWEAGIINQKGKFEKNIKNPRIKEREYTLVWANESQTNRDIVITEGDLDNLIRTKAAIFAGISVLLKKAGITHKEIERLIVAGNLGSHIRPNEAIKIGLFPNVELDKFHFFGNGSLIGATLSCFSKKMLFEVEKTAGSITNIELSSDKSFMDEFIAAMFIPHTNYEF